MQVFVQEIINLFGLEMMPADSSFVALFVWFVLVMSGICITVSMVKLMVYVAVNARKLVG